MLNIVLHGVTTDAPPLLIVPGLFGSARNWNAIARRLAENRQVIALDMRNHGDSFRHDDHSYDAMARDLAGVIDAHGGVADVLGHSMGGKAAMMLALTQPDRVCRLIVADMAPRSYGHADHHQALIDAMLALRIDDLRSRSEADRRLEKDVRDPGTRAFLLQSLALREGPVHWKLNLEVLRAALPDIVNWPARTEGMQFDKPALFLSGAHSAYVRPQDHGRILALFPQARFRIVDNAGHWLHADQPRQVEAEISAFLK